MDAGARPVADAKPFTGSVLDGRFAILARRILLPASPVPWQSRAQREVPPGQPIATTREPVSGGVVLELGRTPPLPNDLWWYHAEVTCPDRPADQVTPPEFFKVPPHLAGEPFPPPDRLPPVIVLVRLQPAQFGRWLALLQAAPYPALVLDAAARTAVLELGDLP